MYIHIFIHVQALFAIFLSSPPEFCVPRAVQGGTVKKSPPLELFGGEKNHFHCPNKGQILGFIFKKIEVIRENVPPVPP